MTTATSETEIEMTTCDACECEITEEQHEDHDGLCPACLAETFICRDCEGRTLKTDAHATVKGHCEACGDAKLEDRRQERFDAAAESARDLLEALIDLDDLAAVKKAVAALKRLQPK
jgi:hypothetical protein